MIALNYSNKTSTLPGKEKAHKDCRDVQNIEMNQGISKRAGKLENSKTTSNRKALSHAEEVASNVDKNIKHLFKSYIINATNVSLNIGNKYRFEPQENIAVKHPVSELNQLKKGQVKYEFDEAKVHDGDPVYLARVEVDGNLFYGSGYTKRIAKIAAAVEALKYFSVDDKSIEIKKKDPQLSKELSHKENKTTAFSKALQKIPISKLTCTKEANGEIRSCTNDLSRYSKPHGCNKIEEYNVDLPESPETQTKTETVISPIFRLNKIISNLKFEIEEIKIPKGNPNFKAYIKIDGQSFCGCGSSKKLAKCDASRKALDYLTLQSETENSI